MIVRATPLPSRRLGRYEVIAEIARGGMGAVLLARLAGVGGFQRLFALKLLHQQYLDDHEFVQMLLDEARIAARINHPNVVSIQEVEESAEHGYFLVMDYVEGFSMWDLTTAAGKLPFEQRARIVIRIVLDALLGLEAAHELTDDFGRPLEVVHRDVSPQNILVGTNGIARVTDFGIAKAAARMSSTRVGQVKGKLAYMSPEQARGKPTDARTDVWAIGVVLWEALAARRLFRVENESETYQRVLMAPIPRLIEVVREAPVAIADVVARALERDPTKRFQSAREMAVALETMARAHGLLADAHEIGSWIRTAFAAQLKLRQEAIRSASDDREDSSEHVAKLPGGLTVPRLPEESVSLTLAPPPGPPDEGSFDETEFSDVSTVDYDAPDTVMVQGPPSDPTNYDTMSEVSTNRVPAGAMSKSVAKAIATLREVQGPDLVAPVATKRAPSRANEIPPAPIRPPDHVPTHDAAHAVTEFEERDPKNITAAVPLVSSIRGPTRPPVGYRPSMANVTPHRDVPAPKGRGVWIAVVILLVAIASAAAAALFMHH